MSSVLFGAFLRLASSSLCLRLLLCLSDCLLLFAPVSILFPLPAYPFCSASCSILLKFNCLKALYGLCLLCSNGNARLCGEEGQKQQ